MATESSSGSAGEDLFEVEAILEGRTVDGVKEYLVRWLGWAPEYDTWEPEDNLLTCHDLIEKFNSTRQPPENVEIKADAISTKKGNRGNKNSNLSSQREKSAVLSKTNLSNDDQSATTPAQIIPVDQSMDQPKIEIPRVDELILNDSHDSSKTTKSMAAVASTEEISPPKKKRKRRPQHQFWEIIPETASTLRDPFWKNLEDGNIDLGDSGLYERVKRGRRSNETTTSSTSTSSKAKRGRKKKSKNLEEDSKTLEEDTGTKMDEESEDGRVENGEKEEESKESESADQLSTDQPKSIEVAAENEVPNGGCQEETMDNNEAAEEVSTNFLEEDKEEETSAVDNNDQADMVSTETAIAMEEEPEMVSKEPEAIPEIEPVEPEKDVVEENLGEVSIVCEKLPGETDQIVQPKQPEAEKEQKELSPTSKAPLFSGGQWRPMKVSPTKLVVESEKPSNEGSTTPASPGISSSTTAKPRPTPGSWMPNVNGVSNGHHPAFPLDPIPSPVQSSLASPLVGSQSPIESGPTEEVVPELPLPITSNLSLSSFFKSELRQSNMVTGNLAVTNFGEFEHACCNGDVEAVRQALLAKKTLPIDVNGRNSLSGNPILMQICLLACDPAHKLDDLIDLLASNGANLNSRNDAGDTALTMAINRNQVCKVTKLLSLGAAINLPNHQGETPLMLACKKNFTAIVFRLLEYGADFNAQSADGKIALDFAMEATANAGGKGCETGLRDRADKIMKVFEQALRMVLSTERFHIYHPLFPLHCYALNESNAFRIVFFFEDPPVEPSTEMTYVLAMAKARFLSIQQVDVRFWGTTPVKSVLLNEVEQTPLTNEGRFMYSLWPIKKGYNDLVITCNFDCKQSLHKLLIHAYALRVSCTWNG